MINPKKKCVFVKSISDGVSWNDCVQNMVPESHFDYGW